MLKKILLIFFIIGMLMCVSAVSAVDNETASLEKHNEKSFRELGREFNVMEDNKEYELENDYICSDERDKDPILNVGNVSIDGKGHTIDGSGVSQGVFVNSDNVTLKNLNFVNCKNEFGSAINGNGNTLNLINCTFVNCYADYLTVAMKNGLVANCTFINNNAKYICSGLSFHFADENDTSVIDNCIFADNYVGNETDNYYVMTNGNLVIKNSIFKGIEEKNAIYDHGNHNISVENCTFYDNAILGAAHTGTFTELWTTIMSTGFYVELSKDYIFDDKSDQSYWNGIPVTRTNLHLDGNGHTIDARGSLFFDVRSENVEFANINFRNLHMFLNTFTTSVCFRNCTFGGTAAGDLMIKNNGTLSLINCSGTLGAELHIRSNKESTLNIYKVKDIAIVRITNSTTVNIQYLNGFHGNFQMTIIN